MAKKNKVVISEAYLNVLREKSGLLDELFADSDTLRVEQAHFKAFARLEKAYLKMDIRDEPYEPQVAAASARGRRSKGAG